MIRRCLLLSILIFPLAATGCSHYSFSGALPGHIKTAAVPLFENKTVEPGIVEELADVIEDAIIRDGSMKIAGEFQADAVVRGTIIEVLDEADTFSAGELAKQFRIRVFADVEFFDRVKNKPLWEQKSMEGWARYDAGGDGVSREDAIQEAMEMLADAIIDKTVAGW